MNTRSLVAILAIAFLAVGASGATFTDWTRLDLTNYIAFGNLDGVPVSFYADTSLGYSTIDGTSPNFDCAAFSPPLPTSDAIYIAATSTPRTYTFLFGAPLRDPIVDFSSLGSDATFNSTPVRLSGTPHFTVTGALVEGVNTNGDGCTNDASGSVQFPGVFCSLAFVLVYPGGTIDGMRVQLGATAVSLPVLSVIVTNALVQVSFGTEPGVNYQPEYLPVIGGANWLSLGSPIQGDGAVHSFLDSATTSNARFYRVRVLCQ